MSERRRPPYLAALLFILVGASLFIRQPPKPLPPGPAVVLDQIPPAATPPRPALTSTSGVSPTAPAAAAPSGAAEAPSVEIRGRIVDPRQMPVPFARIEVFAIDPLGALNRSLSESDAEGAFVVRLAEWSRITLSAKAPGFGRGFLTVQATDRSSPHFTLPLRPPYAAGGIAVRPDGTPLAGATLRFHPLSTRYVQDQEQIALNVIAGTIPPDAVWDARCRRELFLTDAEVVTDAAGVFRVTELVGGIDYVVEAPGSGGRADLYTRGLKEGFRLPLSR